MTFSLHAAGDHQDHADGVDVEALLVGRTRDRVPQDRSGGSDEDAHDRTAIVRGIVRAGGVGGAQETIQDRHGAQRLRRQQ